MASSHGVERHSHAADRSALCDEIGGWTRPFILLMALDRAHVHSHRGAGQTKNLYDETWVGLRGSILNSTQKRCRRRREGIPMHEGLG